MSSYNNIRKIKYTKNPSDIVTLHEYIMFEDSHAKEKYVVFKFSNNVNQRLLGFKFEVLQYNKDNELLEKSTVVHDNFIADANDLFVPNAKLKVNFECESLEVKLESASFDRVAWSGGEFTDNSYRFDSYAETVKNPEKPTPAAVESQAKTEKKHKGRLDFNIRNIFRRNKAAFPAVFNVFLAIIVIGLVVFSTFYFKKVTGAFAVDNFIVSESSPGFVTIISYTGDKDNVEIPSSLYDGKEGYYVIKIGKNAFLNSSVKSIEINTEKELRIERGAFTNCSKLVSVTASSSCGKIEVMGGAFTDCTALTTFRVPTAKLSSKCFDGTNNIKNLAFYEVLFDVNEGKLLDIFSGLKSANFAGLNFNKMSEAPDSFFEGIR